MPGIMFVGASGTGKSTLANWVAGRYSWPLVKSPTHEVYAKYGTTFDKAFSDPDKLAIIQSDILDATVIRLNEAVNKGSFVSERGFDVVVYSSLMCPGFFRVANHDLIADVARRPDVIVCHLKPCQEVIELARKSDGSRRNMFLSDQWVYGIDGALTSYIEQQNIPHITLAGSEMRGRMRTIERVIAAYDYVEKGK